MNQNPGAADWVADRGDKWCAQLSLMEPTLQPVDEPLIRALRLEGPARIADVACGGGGTTFEIARRASAGSVVHGFDIAPKLIALARSRALGAERAVVFEVADVATTAAQQPYDRLVSRFGVMFFDDPQAAFTNLAGWLKPGGRFAFAVWGPPADNEWTTSARDVVARIVELSPADPQAPGPFRYADASTLLALLEHAGFAELDVQDLRISLPIGGGLSPTEAARFALASFSSFAEPLAKAGERAQEEAERSLAAYYSEHQQDGVVRLAANVQIVTGARP